MLDLKKLISNDHPLHPSIESQRLIFSGKFLKDQDILASLFSPGIHDLSLPQKFHLLLSGPFQSQSSSRTENPSQQQNQQQPQNPQQPPNFQDYQQQQFHYLPQQFAYAQQYGYPPQFYPPQVNLQWGQFPPNMNMPNPFQPMMNPNAMPNGMPQYPPMPNQMPNNFQQPMGGNPFPFQAGGQPMFGQENPMRRVGVARINLNFNFTLLLKLALLVYVLGQGGSTTRFVVLIIGALAYFIYKSRVVQLAARIENLNQHEDHDHHHENFNEARNANPNNAQAEAGNHAQQPAQPVPFYAHHPNPILNEVYRFVFPFVLSLMPSWELPEALILPAQQEQQ